MARKNQEKWDLNDGKIVVPSVYVPFVKGAQKWTRSGPVFGKGSGYVVFRGFRAKGQDFTRIDGTRKIQVRIDGRSLNLRIETVAFTNGRGSDWMGETVFLPGQVERPVFPLHVERWKDHAERAALRDILVARGLLPGVSDSDLRKALQWPRETDVELSVAREFLRSIFMTLPWNEKAFAALCECVDVP